MNDYIVEYNGVNEIGGFTRYKTKVKADRFEDVEEILNKKYGSAWDIEQL
jgi:hypothetical protein